MEKSNAQRVTELCRQLNIQPPSYILECHPGVEGIWSGKAQFKDEFAMPSRMSEVKGVLSRRFAKERIAEEVLKWLLDEKRRRQALIAQVWGSP
jgi:hypothetical protein